MNQKLYDYLMKMPKENIICLMWNALDEMESYNGRTKTYCITTALGGACDDRGKCTLPKLEEAMKNTDRMGL